MGTPTPFSVIGKILQKIRKSGRDLTLIVSVAVPTLVASTSKTFVRYSPPPPNPGSVFAAGSGRGAHYHRGEHSHAGYLENPPRERCTA